VLRVPQLAVALRQKDWRRTLFWLFAESEIPAAFFDDLPKVGISGGENAVLPSHLMTPGKWLTWNLLAASCGADALLVTEKDVWNLRHVQSPPCRCTAARYRSNCGRRIFRRDHRSCAAQAKRGRAIEILVRAPNGWATRLWRFRALVGDRFKRRNAITASPTQLGARTRISSRGPVSLAPHSFGDRALKFFAGSSSDIMAAVHRHEVS